MNAPSYFEIQADDTSRAVAFYRAIFGWAFTKAEGLPVEYWRIETEGPRGGLLKRPAKTPPPSHGTNAFVCSMEVVNFDATAAKIVSAGGQIALPKFAVPGVCWQGYKATRSASSSRTRRQGNSTKPLKHRGTEETEVFASILTSHASSASHQHL